MFRRNTALKKALAIASAFFLEEPNGLDAT